MIYPATLNFKVLQNSTWSVVLRAMQNTRPVTSLANNAGVPVFTSPCHKLAANAKVVAVPVGVSSVDLAASPAVAAKAPCGLELNQVYFVSSTGLAENSFTVSATSGGAPLVVSGDAVGAFAVAEPLDLTGYSVDADIYSALTGQLVASFTCTIIDTTNGLIRITLPAATTLTLEPGIYSYDVSLITPTAERYYWLKGTITVERTFSRV